MIYYILYILFFLSILLAFWAMAGYPLFLILLDKLGHHKPIDKDYDYEPAVSLMIVAHNEEKVIEAKLANAISLDYPREKLEIVVASDNSTDSTNDIVEKFAGEHSDFKIVLYCSKEHKGKTNAQNEAHKICSGEILVMTDANTIFDTKAVRELAACFTGPEIAYVCGKLVYSNSDKGGTSSSESTYWNLDLKMRDIESRTQTITAGNGAIYACRSAEYVDFKPILCHDSAMPYYYGLKKKKALFNPDAVAVEKAGETNVDEFNRKVRMNRNLLSTLLGSFKTINIFKLKWFSVFYFGHRTARYLLWLAHLVAFVCSVVLSCLGSIFGYVTLGLQVMFLIISLFQIKKGARFKPLRLLGYYGVTVLAQFVGIWRIITGKAKPIWEKAESTR